MPRASVFLFVVAIADVALLLFVAAGVEADARGAVVVAVVSGIAFVDGVSPRGKEGQWMWTMDEAIASQHKGDVSRCRCHCRF